MKYRLLRSPASQEVRLHRSGYAGGALALMMFALLRRMDGGFGREAITSRYYDVQASQLLKLRWDMPQQLLGVEGFRTGSKWYMYFGPVPSFLRMPMIAIRPSLTGHLGTVMMFIALAVALFAITRLVTRIRSLVRGQDSPVVSSELWSIAIFVFGCGAASTLFFLGTEPWVYHEALMWGVAFTMAAFASILAFIIDRRTKSLLLASLFATAAILSRGPVALGVVAALGLLAAGALFRKSRVWFGLDADASPLRLVASLGLAAWVPMAAFATINYIKFGSLFDLPNSRQSISLVNPNRQAVLASNGGGLFSLRYLITNVAQYVRPDALRLNRLFPFITFPPLANNFGGHLYDTIEPTSSIPSSMPALALLALVGIAVVIWPRSPFRSNSVSLRAILLGSLIGPLVTLTLAYIAQRYIADVIPFLVICGALGMWCVFHWSADRKVARRVLGSFFLALTIGGFIVNLGLAIDYRYLNPFVAEGPRLSAFVSDQYRIDRKWNHGKTPNVIRVDKMPTEVQKRATVAILSGCSGVYWSSGEYWSAIARTRATGLHDFTLRFPAVDSPTWLPVLVAGDAEGSQTLAVQLRGDRRLTFGLRTVRPEKWRHFNEKAGWVRGVTVRYEPGRTYHMRVILDQNNGAVRMSINAADGTTIPASRAFFVPGHLELTPRQVKEYVIPYSQVTIGRNDLGAWTEPRFRGSIVESQPKYLPKICSILDE